MTATDPDESPTRARSGHGSPASVVARRRRPRCGWPSVCGSRPGSCPASRSTAVPDALLAGFVDRRAQRDHLAGAVVHPRADLRADARARGDRRRRARRVVAARPAAGRAYRRLLGRVRHRRRSGRRRHDRHRRAGDRRRGRVRPRGPHPRPAAAQAARRSPTCRASCSSRSTASPRSCWNGRCAAATCRRCTAGSTTASTGWSAGPPAGRRRPGSASAASSTARRTTCPRSAGSTRRPARSSCRTTRRRRRRSSGPTPTATACSSHQGSSYGNLFSGDAERAVLTMSGIARRKEGRLGAGYFGYFSQPQQATRTLVGLVVEIVHERRAAAEQRRRGVEPRVRPRLDVLAAARVHDDHQPRRVGARGDQRHVRGPRRDLRRLPRLRRGVAPLRSGAGRHARGAARPRPADRPHRPRRASGRHGRTRWSCCPTTARRRGRRSCSAPVRRCRSRRPAVRRGGVGRQRRRGRPHRVDGVAPPREQADQKKPTAETCPIVLGSGSLGLISLPGRAAAADPRGDRRRVPGPAPRADRLAGGRLRARPFDDGTSVGARRRAGQRNLATGEVVGDDPLEPFGPAARASGDRSSTATRPSPT